MNRKTDRERQRRRERDLAVLREAIKFDERIHTSDRELRRLVKLGYATNPVYGHGLPGVGDAFGDITEAGRRFVEEAAK